jgi:signal transduction histidine kinase
MKLLTMLFGWTGYEPLNFFLSSMNIILNVTFCLLLEYIPLAHYLRVKPITVVMLNGISYVLSGVFFLCFPFLINNSETGQIVGLLFYFLLFMPIALYLLRDCFFQNLFMIAFSQCSTQFVLGIGNWLEFRYGNLIFPETHYEVAFLAKLILIPIFLVFCTRLLKKLFAAWGGEAQTQPFWKALWLIPTTLCVLTALSGTVYTLGDENRIAFLLSRLFSITALFVCVDMMTDIMTRERETAAARMRVQVMTAADAAHKRSQAEKLTALENMNSIRSNTAAALEQIIGFAKSGKHSEISNLLRNQTAVLDTFSSERFCENEAVNALVTYYGNIAKNEGIKVSFKLDVPKQAGRIASVDLSRIVGNMLENAVEACRAMEYGAKNIRLQSMITGDMLVFGMNNSFDGNFNTLPDGEFISRKRESGIATGLRSIRAVAEKYDGSVRFEAADRVFKTSVRLDMSGEQ